MSSGESSEQGTGTGACKSQDDAIRDIEALDMERAWLCCQLPAVDTSPIKLTGRVLSDSMMLRHEMAGTRMVRALRHGLARMGNRTSCGPDGETRDRTQWRAQGVQRRSKFPH